MLHHPHKDWQGTETLKNNSYKKFKFSLFQEFINPHVIYCNFSLFRQLDKKYFYIVIVLCYLPFM